MFFVSFLQDDAYDWWETLGRRRLGLNPSWADVKAAFIRHYMGDSDKGQVRRQIERTFQGAKERCTVFIPKMVRLYELVEPDKPERELVESIRDKLRQEYKSHLVMQSIYTLEQLNDCCLRVEHFLSANKPQNDDQPNKQKHKNNNNQKNDNKAKSDKKNTKKEKKTKTTQTIARRRKNINRGSVTVVVVQTIFPQIVHTRLKPTDRQ